MKAGAAAGAAIGVEAGVPVGVIAGGTLGTAAGALGGEAAGPWSSQWVRVASNAGRSVRRFPGRAETLAVNVDEEARASANLPTVDQEQVRQGNQIRASTIGSPACILATDESTSRTSRSDVVDPERLRDAAAGCARSEISVRSPCRPGDYGDRSDRRAFRSTTPRIFGLSPSLGRDRLIPDPGGIGERGSAHTRSSVLHSSRRCDRPLADGSRTACRRSRRARSSVGRRRGNDRRR